MVVGAWWFAVMGLLVKLSGRRLPSSQIVLVRAALTLALRYWAVRQAGVPSIWGAQRTLLLVRGGLGAVGINCFYYSLVHLPLGEATLIQYTNPILAIILAVLWVGQRVRPIVFHLPLVTFPTAIPFASANWLMPTGWEWLLLLGVGMSTQLAQTSMTRGLQAETAVRATTAGYLQIVFAGIWGALLLGERPSVWTLAGAAVIVVSALVLALGKRRAEIGDE